MWFTDNKPHVMFVVFRRLKTMRCMAAELSLAAHKVKKAMENLLTPNPFCARNSATTVSSRGNERQVKGLRETNENALALFR